MQAPASRRTYLDVLRGVAVLVMIEAHVIDSWTRDADRLSRAFGESLILGGFGAPLFLFLAGVAASMSAGSKARRSGDPAAAVLAVQKRGVQIFFLALAFRLQSLVVSHGEAWTLLKVDILNVIGPSIVLAAALWGAVKSPPARLAVFALSTAAIVWLTPVVREAAWLAALPDWAEAYIRPIPGLTNFTFLPWAAFVTAGAFVGVLLDNARTAAADRRVNIALGAGGAAMAIAAYEASFLPALSAGSRFWTTSASFFFMRLGVMIVALALAYVWEQRPVRHWSPMQLLGRTSLFIYWIHVEMVYGIVSLSLHRALSLGGAWIALAIFWAFLLLSAALKELFDAWWEDGAVSPRREGVYARS